LLRRFGTLDRDDFDARCIHVGQADIAYAVCVLAHFRRDLLVPSHLLRAACIISLLHREFFPIGVGARGSVAGVDRDFAARTADGAPVGDAAGENILDLLLAQVVQRIFCVDDYTKTIVGDDRRLHVHAFRRSGADFGRLRAAARHADLGGAIGNGGDAGSGTFRGNVKGGAGVLCFELLRQLRHELGAEGIGAFDDEPIRACFSGSEGKAGEECE
jgi:hypothetical protein